MDPVCPGRCGQPLQEPVFRCFCGDPAWSLTSGTERNPGRKFFICQKASVGRGCKLWIWEDGLLRYVAEMVEYSAASTHDCLHEQLSIAREALVNCKEKLASVSEEADDLVLKVQDLEVKLLESQDTVHRLHQDQEVKMVFVSSYPVSVPKENCGDGEILGPEEGEPDHIVLSAAATMAMSVNSPIMNEDLFGCLLENNATDMETAFQHVGLNDNNLDYGIDDHSSNAASDNSSNSESLLPVAYPCNAVSCINETTPQTFTTNSLPLIALHPFAAQGSPETSKPGPDVFGFGTGLHNVNRPNELNLNLSQSATGCMDGPGIEVHHNPASPEFTLHRSITEKFNIVCIPWYLSRYKFKQHGN